MLDLEELDRTNPRQKLGSVVGSTDLTNPDNLQVTSASLELTHRSPQYPLHSPIRDRDAVKELDTNHWLKIIDKLAAEGVETVTLTGGEPTLRQDFRTLLQYAIKQFDTVTVQTTGTTRKNLSDFNCVVSVPIEYWDSLNNNEIRRMTNPEKWGLNREGRNWFVCDVCEEGSFHDKEVIEHVQTEHLDGRDDEDEVDPRRLVKVTQMPTLEPRDPTVCSTCGKQASTFQRAVNHLKREHETDVLQRFENQTGVQLTGDDDTLDRFNKMLNHRQFDAEMFLDRRDPVPAKNEERALKLAVQKAEMVDNPVVIRTNIFSNNDIRYMIAFAQQIDADVVFKPMYPVADNKKLLEQVPAPRRFANIMAQVRDINQSIQNELTINSPLYKAWKFEKDMDEHVPTDVHRDTYVEWWERGRISEVGVSTLHVTAQGDVLPSRYIRHDQYRYGHILKHDWDDIYAGIAQFNDSIISDKDLRPVTGFDLRQRSIAGDPNIYLNDAYKGGGE